MWKVIQIEIASVYPAQEWKNKTKQNKTKPADLESEISEP